MSQKILTNRIMRRVYAVWILRKLSSPVFMKSLIFIGILRWSFLTVSVPNILHNSPSILNVGASYVFFSAAFTHAELNTKILFLALILTFVFLVRDLFAQMFVYQSVAS